MKKVTAKGAYKPKVKKQMIKRRAPLVETKQRDTASIALINGHPVLKKMSMHHPMPYNHFTPREIPTNL